MSLSSLAQWFKGLSLHNVNTFLVGDVYQLVNCKDYIYTVAVLEFQGIEVNGSTDSIRCRLSVIDRLTQDESNFLDIVDDCTRNLKDIIRLMEDEDIAPNGIYNIQIIKQDFADHCAGVYAELVIPTEAYMCSHQVNLE